MLLSLERQGVLDVTRERHPIHYHVALFPSQYKAYVTQLTRRGGPSPSPTPDPSANVYTVQVQRGDSLWSIARSHGTTVRALRRANDLRGSRIFAGQRLTVPGS